MSDRLTAARLPPLLIALSLLVVLAGCNRVSAVATEPIPPGDQLPAELGPVAEAYRILLDDHVDHEVLEPGNLSAGAIRGMLAALDDPHASYLTAEQHSRDQEGYRGYFEGIGAQVTLTEAGLTVIAPIPGAPAEEAGIRAGDLILSVDGQDIEGLTLVESVNLIRGPGGTEVTLLVRHVGEFEDASITVTRGRIPIESTAFRMLEDGIGHLWIYSFSNTTEEEVRRAMDELEAAGGRGLILDLRNNPGGLLASVISVTDLFLDSGTILYEIDADGDRNDYEAVRRGPATDVPLVVIVNQFSASASEIMAGAIQTSGRAIVVGSSTFGKGSVNIARELSDGSAIYFTIRRWYLSDGTQIEGEGVTPDIEIEAEAHPLPIEFEQDVALKRAFEVLDEQIAVR
ncbi:Carboxy-terminal processing protease CtpA [Geodia barretti]|uniref:Carboxy-terminal processing protease CtpA n=1 Tax=Geodia barretti TaxID=519541 RepID=A0AA35WL46_GEOBA|nr:Carboxy-terminal processing protease CtpA [Geodia barretti]